VPVRQHSGCCPNPATVPPTWARTSIGPGDDAGAKCQRRGRGVAHEARSRGRHVRGSGRWTVGRKKIPISFLMSPSTVHWRLGSGGSQLPTASAVGLRLGSPGFQPESTPAAHSGLLRGPRSTPSSEVDCLEGPRGPFRRPIRNRDLPGGECLEGDGSVVQAVCPSVKGDAASSHRGSGWVSAARLLRASSRAGGSKHPAGNPTPLTGGKLNP
jgi:hypothetical protein